MINLNEVANKVSEILNSVDNPLRIGNERVIFDVATEGYRVDSIAKREKGKNAIPVFIALAGGENQPIPNLRQQSKSFNIAIYYPIIYKDIFIDLEDYLDSVVVGKMINFGESTKGCLCNLGVAQFGEIQNLDLEAFKQFVANKYEKTIEISVNWHSMILTLYTTKMNDGYIFGNEIKYELKMHYYIPAVASIRYDDTTYVRYNLADQTVDNVNYYCWRADLGGGSYDFIYTTKNPNLINDIVEYISWKNTIDVYKKPVDDFVLQSDKVEYVNYTKTNNSGMEKESIIRADAGTGAQISPIAEQRIGTDNYAKNVANITNYNKSMVVYPNLDQTLWKLILLFYNIQDLSFISFCNLIKKYSNGYEFEFKQIVLNYNENSELGSPLSFTLTFGDAK